MGCAIKTKFQSNQSNNQVNICKYGMKGRLSVSSVAMLAGAGWSDDERGSPSGTGLAAAASSAAVDAIGSEAWARQQATAGRCHVILTSSYGYRQFIPLEAALAPAGADPLADFPPPAASATTAMPTDGATARPGDRILLRFQVRRGRRAKGPKGVAC